MKIVGFEVIPFETFVGRISFGCVEEAHHVVQTLTALPVEPIAPLHPR